MQYKSYLIEQNISSLNERFVLFYGENLGLKLDLKKKIKETFVDHEILNLNQEDLLNKSNSFYNEINSNSLFQKEKLIFIDQSTDKIFEILEDIVEKNIDYKVFVFSDILEKKSKLRNYFEKSKVCAAVPCYEDNDISIKKIITNKLKGYKGLTPRNLNLILENSGLNRIKLNNEIEKILTFFTNKVIDDEILATLLDARINDDFNILRDEAFKGNKSKTNKLLTDTILEPEKYIFYLNIINNRLNKLYEITEGDKNMNIEQRINQLKPPIFWKDKPNFVSQAQKWTKTKIKTIFDNTYNLELKIKTQSALNQSILIKKLIVDICEMANS